MHIHGKIWIWWTTTCTSTAMLLDGYVHMRRMHVYTYAPINVRVNYMYLLTSMLLRSATTREGKPPSMHQKRATDMTASTRWGRTLSLSCAQRHAHSCVQLVTYVKVCFCGSNCLGDLDHGGKLMSLDLPQVYVQRYEQVAFSCVDEIHM